VLVHSEYCDGHHTARQQCNRALAPPGFALPALPEPEPLKATPDRLTPHDEESAAVSAARWGTGCSSVFIAVIVFSMGLLALFAGLDLLRHGFDGWGYAALPKRGGFHTDPQGNPYVLGSICIVFGTLCVMGVLRVAIINLLRSLGESGS
jgi:hypothetical protein